MPAAAKKKTLNVSDITHLIERWASAKRSITVLENAKSTDDDIARMIKRHAEEMKPLLDKYDVELDKLEARATKIYDQVIEWLGKRSKSVVVESKRAIAEFFKGKVEGRTRVADPEKFVAKCKERGLDPWAAMSVLIKDGEKLLGKDDFNAVCSKPKVDVETATLELK